MSHRHACRHIAFASLALGMLCAASPAMALYKVVGPDGKVTYTDRAPSDKPSQSLKTNGAVADTASLPYEVRQAASRYPVTLYTSADCAPCDQGRNALKARGIPFAEKTIQTADDDKALQRLEGTSNVPVLRIGTQQLKGFAATEWNSFLDAADYPKQSRLPPNYQWPKAAPLVAVAPKSAASAGNGRTNVPNSRPTAPRTDPADNPTGIRF